MGQTNFSRAFLDVLRNHGLAIVLFAAIAIIFMQGIQTTKEASSAEELSQIESNIRRAVVSCYALEGFYPDTLQYLQDNYRLQVDGDKYVVHYEIFGSNMMPDIKVLAR